MSQFEAGAAKICVDPTPEMFPFPPFWGIAKEGIYASIYVRALALKCGETTFVIVSNEFGSATEELRKKVAEKYGIPEENFLFTDIHNHGGPYMGGPNNGGYTGPDHRAEYEEMLHAKMEEVIGEALSKLRPALFGYGTGKSYINVNRDLQLEDGTWSQANNFDAPSDKTLAVMKIEDTEGNLIAAVLNHCTHANLTYLCKDVDGKSKTCADFPGYTCDFIEKRYGNGAVVLWTSGAAGNQNAIPCFRGEPHYTGEDLTNFCAPYGMGYRYAQYVGEYHAIDACKVLKEIQCSEVTQMKNAVTEVNYHGQAMPEGVNHMMQTLRAQDSVKIMEQLYPDQVKDGRIIDRTLVEGHPTGKDIPSQMQLMIIGDVALVTTETEIYNQIGTLLKEQSPMEKTIVVTHAFGLGTRVGYVQDDSSSHNLTFQHFGDICQEGNNEIVLGGMKDLFEKVNQ